MTGPSSLPADRRRASVLELSWPADWAAWFGVGDADSPPIVLEIGFGRGDFTLHLAQRHPHAGIVGVEVSNRSLDALERRLDRTGVANVRLVQGAAETALHHLFTPGRIAAIHVNFPDPWFKARHEQRRLIRRETVDLMVSRLAPGGQLTIATDVRDYARGAAHVLRRTPGLDNRLAADWIHALSGRRPTKYERRGLEAGRPAHFLSYRRNTSPAPFIPIASEVPMPHIGFEGAVSLDAVSAAFEPFEVAADGINVSVLAVYRGRDMLLFEVFVHEPTIDQRVAIGLRRLEDGRSTLALAQIGLARPTPGVHLAVARIAAWLAGVLPDARISERRLAVARSALGLGGAAAEPMDDEGGTRG